MIRFVCRMVFAWHVRLCVVWEEMESKQPVILGDKGDSFPDRFHDTSQGCAITTHTRSYMCISSAENMHFFLIRCAMVLYSNQRRIRSVAQGTLEYLRVARRGSQKEGVGQGAPITGKVPLSLLALQKRAELRRACSWQRFSKS